MAKKLTAKQAKFIEIYLSNGQNAADAYKQAYDTTMRSSLCSAEAKKMLNSPKLLPYLRRAEQRVEQAITRATEAYAVSRERNVAELARMAYANMDDYTRLVGNERVVDLAAATRDHLAAVQEIIVEDFKDGRGEDARDVRKIRLKLADKGMAIERLNKMFGWIIDKSEVGRPGDFAGLADHEVDARLLEELQTRGLTEKQARALLESNRESNGLDA